MLRFSADRTSVASVLLALALLILPFVVQVPGALVVPWVLLASLVSIVVCLVNHNHAHVPTFRGWRANVVFDLFLTLARGSSSTFIIVIHNLNHHRFAATEQDWFCPSNAGAGPRLLQPIRYVLETMRKTWSQGPRVVARLAPARRRQLRVEQALAGVFFASLVAIDWQRTLGFVLVPWMIGNGFVVLTNLLHHPDCDGASALSSSVNYLSPWECRVFLNGGYHTAHHLSPATHWSELPRLHREQVAERIDPRLVRGSMWAQLFRDYVFAFGRQPSDHGVIWNRPDIATGFHEAPTPSSTTSVGTAPATLST